jgi:TolB-like protein/Flp pilus assembly protein TadD
LINPPSRLATLLAELKRRKVLQAATGYAVVAWIVLQIGEVTFEPLGIPQWGMTLLIAIAVAGFPVAMVISWFFDLTLKGFEKTAEPQTGSRAGDAAHARRQPPIDDMVSVAVLPFDDMSPEHDQAYLCDGIAEEILNRLAQVRDLHVASRTSSFRFRGMPLSASSIGKELNVSAVLEGSVRKADNQIRITTQLIDVSNDFHLWSNSYDGDLERIFDIQTEIAANVADSLSVTLGTRQDPANAATKDVKAYEYFLKGQHYFHRWGTRNVAFAIQMFQKAVDIDPSYARAWAALSDCFAMTCMYWNATEDNLEAAEQASLSALKLQPGLAQSHVSRGLSHFVHHRSDAAIAEFETALGLDPALFEAWYFYGRVRFQRGELEEAAKLFEQAERLDPEDFQAPILLRQIYFSLGRLEAAREAARRGIERAERHLELNPDDTRALNLGLGGLASLGDTEKTLQFARRSLEIDGENPDTLYNVACGYALVGETERALDCLERASIRGMAIADWAENDSDLASVQNEPRFRRLIAQLKTEDRENAPRS